MHNHYQTYFIPGNILAILFLLSLLVFYVSGVRQLGKSGKGWSLFRSLCFGSGIALCILVFIPPLADYGHHSLKGHMVQHILIGMLAPLGLVLGAPLSLAYQVLPVRIGRKVTSFLGSIPFKLLGHPFTAFVLNIGGMFVLYLSPLFKIMQGNLWVHYLVHFHFLAAGYLFVWSIAGPDPAPKRPGFTLRFLVLFISLATHAFLSKFMYAYHFPKNTHFSISEIQDAAMIMYYGGDFAEVLLAVAFFSLWFKRKTLNPQPMPAGN